MIATGNHEGCLSLEAIRIVAQILLIGPSGQTLPGGLYSRGDRRYRFRRPSPDVLPQPIGRVAALLRLGFGLFGHHAPPTTPRLANAGLRLIRRGSRASTITGMFGTAAALALFLVRFSA